MKIVSQHLLHIMIIASYINSIYLSLVYREIASIFNLCVRATETNQGYINQKYPQVGILHANEGSLTVLDISFYSYGITKKHRNLFCFCSFVVYSQCCFGEYHYLADYARNISSFSYWIKAPYISLGLTKWIIEFARKRKIAKLESYSFFFLL